MELERYLEELDKTPDGELRDKLGVWDNFAIQLGLDFQEANAWLAANESLRHKGNGNLGRELYTYVPGTIIVQLNPFPDIEIIDPEGNPDYQISISLHSVSDGRLQDSELKEMAEVIKMIGAYIRQQSIAACMPKTKWQGNKDPVVYRP